MLADKIDAKAVARTQRASIRRDTILIRRAVNGRRLLALNDAHGIGANANIEEPVQALGLENAIIGSVAGIRGF